MRPEKLVFDTREYVIEQALAYLYGDRCFPDVGMGMSYKTALELALKEYEVETTPAERRSMLREIEEKWIKR